jgi:hypothetical protein
MAGTGMFRMGLHRAVTGGFVLMVLSSYLLLLLGVFDRTIGRITGEALSTDSVTVSIGSIHTDLFWRSTVDTVLVTDPHGLLVRVCDGDVRGALHVFLASRSVREVRAATLEIAVPRPVPGRPRTTVADILVSIDRGVICSADSLVLDYGFITDSAGILIDSMSFTGTVGRDNGISVSAVSAAVWVRNLGMVRGSGQAGLLQGRVTSSGFAGSTPYGNIYFSGWMDGADGAIHADADGSLTTAGFDLPLEASLDFEGTVTGTISDPTITTVLRSGTAEYGGIPVEFTADTAIVTREGVALRGFGLEAEGLTSISDLQFSFVDLSWTVGTQLDLDRFDPSTFGGGLPPADLTGTARVDAYGTSEGADGASAVIALRGSVIDGVPVSSASIDASFQSTSWTASLEVSAPAGRVAFSGNGLLGSDALPSTYRGHAEIDIPTSVPLADLLGADLPLFEDLTAEFEIAGTRSRTGLTGTANAGLVELQGVTLAGASAEGSVTMLPGGPEGWLSASCDSIRTGGMAFSASGRADMLDGEYSFSGLEVALPGGIELTGSGVFSPGDTSLVAFSGIRAGISKLRLVEDGCVRARILPGSMRIDTAWVRTPHGILSLRGESGPADSLGFRLSVEDADLASIAAVLDLEGSISGIGTLVLEASTGGGELDASLTGVIRSPTWGSYVADSITIDLLVRDSDLDIAGVYSWQDGIRSGIRGRIDDCWSPQGIDIAESDIEMLELEVNRWGDWVFYALPVPLRTRGADLSAHALLERRPDGTLGFDFEAVAMADRLTVTSLGMPIDGVVLYVTHHYPDTTGYTTRISAASTGPTTEGVLSAELLLDLQTAGSGFRIGRYSFTAGFDRVRTTIGDFAALRFSGSLHSEGDDPASRRPMIGGKIEILDGIVGRPQTGGQASEPAPLPFDLSIAIRSNRGVWFRNSLADIEMGVDLLVSTQDALPSVGGEIKSLRGQVHLLDRDFRITQGTIEFIPGDPPEQRLSILAETEIRGTVNRNSYLVTVSIQGSLSSPTIILTGTGPAGDLTQEDIIALLALGMTYGELQQMDTGAMRDQLEEAAQSYVGRLLARSLREGVGLDELQLTPEFFSDSTSLTVNLGKYVLPDLFVSYTGDVFSTEPGTISAQYFIQRDLYVMGSTKSTLHGEQEPSLELHYTLRY